MGNRDDPPLITLHLNPLSLSRHNKTRNPHRIPIPATRPSKNKTMRRPMHSRLPHLPPPYPPPLNTPLNLPHRPRLHKCSITPMTPLSQPKRNPNLSLQPPQNQLLLLLRAPKPQHHPHIREIPDNGMFILQIIKQPQPLFRQMFPYDRHPQIPSLGPTTVVLATVSRWERQTPEAGGVG